MKLNSIIFTYKLTQYDNLDDLPEEPSEPEAPTGPDYPSKEYDGKDMPLNQHLPSDVDFPQLHVSSKDGKDVIEITGVSVDFTADPTGKNRSALHCRAHRKMPQSLSYWLWTTFYILMKRNIIIKNTILPM